MSQLWMELVENPVVCKHHIRPSDLDSLGHVNNAVALELFEFGRLQWSNINQVCLKDNLISVVTRINVAYNREIFVELVEIVTELVNDNFFELEFKQTVYTQSEDVASLEGRVFIALIDNETKQPQRLKRCFKSPESAN